MSPAPVVAPPRAAVRAGPGRQFLDHEFEHKSQSIGGQAAGPRSPSAGGRQGHNPTKCVPSTAARSPVPPSRARFRMSRVVRTSVRSRPIGSPIVDHFQATRKVVLLEWIGRCHPEFSDKNANSLASEAGALEAEASFRGQSEAVLRVSTFFTDLPEKRLIGRPILVYSGCPRFLWLVPASNWYCRYVPGHGARRACGAFH